MLAMATASSSSTTTTPCERRSKCCCRCRAIACSRRARRTKACARWRGARRPRPAGHELPQGGHVGRGGRRAVPRDPRALPDGADRAAHCVDASRNGGRARQGRRRRLSRQALGRCATADDGAQSAASCAACRSSRSGRRARAPSRAPRSRQKFDLCGLVFESERDARSWSRRRRTSPRPTCRCSSPGRTARARKCWRRSFRRTPRVRGGPFVKVNVGALPKDLMEAELFGAEAGAYTGATKVRQGRFEAADGGTLFLDEIGNLSLRRPGEAAARAADRRVRAARAAARRVA